MIDDVDPTIPRPFSVAGLAEHWGCSPSMVRKLINEGRLGFFRLGTLIRISQASVEEFERANTMGGMASRAIDPRAQPALEDAPSPARTVTGPRNIGRAPRRRPQLKRPNHDD